MDLLTLVFIVEGVLAVVVLGWLFHGALGAMFESAKPKPCPPYIKEP